MKMVKYFTHLVSVSLMVYLSDVANADHSWNNYHWASTSKPITLQVIDSVTDDWGYQLAEAISQWSQSLILNPVIMAVNDKVKTRKDCELVAGQLRVCNWSYGITGWLGQTVVGFDGNGHIDKARTRLNDSFEQYWNFVKKNHIMCHELGHVFGLGHISEDGSSQQSCMDLSNDPLSQWPNQHDYVQLLQIYAHKEFYNSYDNGAGVDSSKLNLVDPPKGNLIFKGPQHEVWVAPREDGGMWVHFILLVPDSLE